MINLKRQAPSLDLAILGALSHRSPQTMDELRQAIQQSGELDGADFVRANKRPNEPKWYSDMSNRLQPARSGSLAGKGYVIRVEHGTYAITPLGQTYLDEQRELMRELEPILAHWTEDR